MIDSILEQNNNEQPHVIIPAWQQLIQASCDGNLEVVNRLLEIPAVAAMATTRDNLVLWAAVQKGHLAIVNRLLEIPATTATAAALSSDALNWAAIYGKLEIVNRLLKIDSVCEIFSQYPDGFSAFFRDRLNDIYNREDYRNEPYDYEIDMVESLQEIATRNNIPLSSFSEEQNEVLKFTTRTNKSLLSNLLACLEEPSELPPDQHSFSQALQFSSGAASSQSTSSDDLSAERDERDAKKSHCP